MKAYIVIAGAHEDAEILGVYSSAERAIAAHPPAKKYRVDPLRGIKEVIGHGEWHQYPDGDWFDGVDLAIRVFEVDPQ